MDGVLCNFIKAHKDDIEKNPSQIYPQSQWGFFLKLEEIPGAIEAFRKLQEYFEVWILTRPSFYNVNCFTEKAEWVLEHIDFEALTKTIMCGDKSLLKGDYLIDDKDGDGQSDFEGEWIEFGSEKFPDWDSVTEYLIYKNKYHEW
jgi:5'(3')-deoxyribonucleotidase